MPYSCSSASSPLSHRRIRHSVLWRDCRAGVLAGLDSCAAHRARCRPESGHVWNLCVISLFTALVAQRLLLIAIN